MTEDEVFHAALAQPPARRASFLDQACAGNPTFRAAVEARLLAHENPGSDPNSASPPAMGYLAEMQDSGVAREEQNAAAGAKVWGSGNAGDHRGASFTATEDFHPQSSAGVVIAGRYKLREQIGEGGMGTVWMADQTEPVKRKVAVKLIRVERGQSKTILARFEAERQAIALMDHPHIAKLLDAGTTGAGSPFFVMELVKGIPLNDYCDQHRLTIAERLNLFMQICSAVQHAHQKGIIHRDLKPSNILVESHDGKPVPKVIDFGLAKATTGLQLTEQSMFTAFGSVLGTPLYMAPEQAKFNAVDVDTRADVYALGVILYELLTGTTPLTKETIKKAALDEMLRLVREQEAPTPSSRLSSADNAPSVAASRQIEPAKLGRFVKGELDWIVLKALSKDRDRRYETANGFAKDIERFLNHEPVQAGPPSVSYRMRKFVQRNKGQVIAASLVLLALVAGVIGTTVGLFEAKRQEHIADKKAKGERLAKLQAEAKQAEAQKQKLRAEASEKLAGERLVQVEAERKKAEDEKQIAKAVKDFLQTKVLAQSDTTFQADLLLQSGGSTAEAKLNPTIRELLDRAAKELDPDKIEANFPNQPLVQAEILGTVGEAYRGVGEAATAIPFLTRSVALFKAKLGPDHPYTLTSMDNLAQGHQDAGQFDKALPLFEETLTLKKAKLGPDHPHTLNSMNNPARCYHATGNFDKALPLFEETLTLKKAKLGPDHPYTLATMNNLAAGYQDAGKLDKALPLYEETLMLTKAKLGPDHPHTLTAMNNLALCYHDTGKLDKALPLFEETFTLRKEKLGPDHPNTLSSMNNMALCYYAAGKLDKALPLFEETLTLQKVKLGPDHPHNLVSMYNLALCYEGKGKLDKALPLYEETLKLMKAKLGPNHPKTLTSMASLAMCYKNAERVAEATPLLAEVFRASNKHPTFRWSGSQLLDAYVKAGKSAEARKLIEELLADARQTLPKESPQLAGQLALFSLSLLEMKGYNEAEPLLRECLAIRQKNQPDVWSTFNTQSLLGGALLGQALQAKDQAQKTKLLTEAEPVLLKGYEGMMTREKTIPSAASTRLPEALDRLIELYTTTNKPDEVKKYQELRAKYSTPKEKKK